MNHRGVRASSKLNIEAEILLTVFGEVKSIV